MTNYDVLFFLFMFYSRYEQDQERTWMSILYFVMGIGIAILGWRNRA